MEMRFCRRCGIPLEHIEHHIFRCQNNHVIYANASPTVGIFFLDDHNTVFLARRGIEPRKGMLDSFGGFLDGNESLEAAAARELREELSLTPDEYEPLHYLCSYGTTYSYGGESTPITSTMFWSRFTTNRSLAPSDDVAEIVKQPLSAVNLDDLHQDDIRFGIITLQKLHQKEVL